MHRPPARTALLLACPPPIRFPAELALHRFGPPPTGPHDAGPLDTWPSTSRALNDALLPRTRPSPGTAGSPKIDDGTRRSLARVRRLGRRPDARVTVRVLASAHPNALAAGLPPGLRAVYVTEGLLARLPPEETAAVVAHELGHHHRGHVALRVGAVAAFVLPWLGATAAAIPGAFGAGALLAGPYALGLVRLMRWTEHDADAYAARRTDGAALARGLRRLDGGRPRGRLGRLLSPHPTPGERAGHLAERRHRPAEAT